MTSPMTGSGRWRVLRRWRWTRMNGGLVFLLTGKSSIPTADALCFVWRACRGRIPTADALLQRNIVVPSPACPLCYADQEDANHLFISCPFAAEILSWLFTWCGLPPMQFSGVFDFVAFAANWGRCPKKRRIITAIFYGYLWSLWRARNDKLFNNKSSSAGSMADNIVTLACWNQPSTVEAPYTVQQGYGFIRFQTKNGEPKLKQPQSKEEEERMEERREPYMCVSEMESEAGGGIGVWQRQRRRSELLQSASLFLRLNYYVGKQDQGQNRQKNQIS
ncbi:hypothetical protein LXL04_013639 [Taraxacum kok-saghyz]